MINEYENDLKINKYKLHEEWELQPELYAKWATRVAEALFERDQMKEELDLVKAEIDGEIRRNPSEFGFDKKPTEVAILNCIIESKKFQNITNKFLEAKRSYNIMLGVKEAMEHRKKALESETSLWIGGYYSEPRLPKEAENIKNEASKERIRRRMRR